MQGVLGMSTVICDTGDKAKIVSFGYAAEIGGGWDSGLPLIQNADYGWNWAIKDQLSGITYSDLILKAKSR